MTDNPFAPAVRRRLKARVAFDGPTGAGKTWTALQWATVLANGGGIAMIDTEHGSAKLYADQYEFDTVEFKPPYDPDRLVKLLGIAAEHGYDCVVIDSLSHFWEGEGGTLDIADAAGARAKGNSFAGWKEATPRLRHLVDTMLAHPAHIVATMRSKMEYVLDKDERTGKTQPKKVGMAPVMRNGIEYEFTLLGELDLEHRLLITKSRCSDLADGMFTAGRAGEAAQQFLDWLDSGDDPDDMIEAGPATRDPGEGEPAGEATRVPSTPVGGGDDSVQGDPPDRPEIEAGTGSPVPPAALPAAAPPDAAGGEAAGPAPGGSPSDGTPEWWPAFNKRVWALIGEAWPDESDESIERRRLWLIGEVSGGRTESSKELAEHEQTAFEDALRDVAEGRAELVPRAVGGYELRPRSGGGGASVTDGGASSDSTGAPPAADSWAEWLASADGRAENGALKRARRIAGELGVEPPTDRDQLAGLPVEVAERVLAEVTA